MKIVIDSNNLECKVGSKTFGLDMTVEKQMAVESALRSFLIKNTKMSDYEEDCMWMSYRYCIGRHTIASHMHAHDIWVNCNGRMSPERQLFNAYDINREIEHCLSFNKPYFWFPITSHNRIYTTAIDIFCEFLEDYDIKSKKDLIKYRDVKVFLCDNERGYKIETTTWEEYLRPIIYPLLLENNYPCENEDEAWKIFCEWKDKPKKEDNFKFPENICKEFEKLALDIPNEEYYFMSDVQDLFVWNDLVHALDFEHHHKSVLIDGTECEWFWTWTDKTELHDDGNYYKAFGYKKIRVPVDSWNGVNTTWIPDESIINDLY